jgi:hypothetical protein
MGLLSFSAVCGSAKLANLMISSALAGPEGIVIYLSPVLAVAATFLGGYSMEEVFLGMSDGCLPFLGDSYKLRRDYLC